MSKIKTFKESLETLRDTVSLYKESVIHLNSLENGFADVDRDIDTTIKVMSEKTYIMYKQLEDMYKDLAEEFADYYG